MIKNIVFDLGGVVIGRDTTICAEETNRFFSFLKEENERFPKCWVDFDRGILTQHETAKALAGVKNCSVDICNGHIDKAINVLAEFPHTVALIRELSEKGYKLYVLSNMSHEFYERLKTFDVFHYFDGEVVSCYEHLVKPDSAFYRLLLDRYGLIPEETLFIDDKKKNVEAAAALGIDTLHFTDKEKGCEAIRERLGL